MDRRDFLKTVGASAAGLAIAGPAFAQARRWTVGSCPLGLTLSRGDNSRDDYKLSALREIVRITKERLSEGPMPVLRFYREDLPPVGMLVDIGLHSHRDFEPDPADLERLFSTYKRGVLTDDDVKALARCQTPSYLLLTIESDHDLSDMHAGPALHVSNHYIRRPAEGRVDVLTDRDIYNVQGWSVFPSERTTYADPWGHLLAREGVVEANNAEPIVDHYDLVDTEFNETLRAIFSQVGTA